MSRRRLPVVGLLIASLVFPVSAPPAVASHVTVVDISRTACTEEVPRGRFADVAPASTFALAVDCVAWYGITTGRTPTSYDPASTVTRLQMALFVERLAGSLGVQLDTTDAGFTDLDGVPPAARTAIDSLANAGVVTGTGTSPKTYSPAAPVTRAQMAAYLNRLESALHGQPFPATSDAFDDDASSPLARDIDGLASAGILSGTGQDRTYSPGALVTRAQMAGFMARYVESVLARSAGARLELPGAFTRGTTTELTWSFSDAAGRAYDDAQLDWYLTSDAGLVASDVALSFRDPSTGDWVDVPLEEEAPGGPGALLSWGVWRTFPLPVGGVSVAVRLTVSPAAEAGPLHVVSQLGLPHQQGEVLAETYDVVGVR